LLADLSHCHLLHLHLALGGISILFLSFFR
jgi:hypothetical protein